MAMPQRGMRPLRDGIDPLLPFIFAAYAKDVAIINKTR
jgi:hypothetical protein